MFYADGMAYVVSNPIILVYISSSSLTLFPGLRGKHEKFTKKDMGAHKCGNPL